MTAGRAGAPGSVGSFDNTRRTVLMGAQATSDSHINSIGQRLRASYTHAMPRSYIKPFVDVKLQYDGLLSNKVSSHSGSVKLNWRF